MRSEPSRVVITTIAAIQLLAVGLWASGRLTLGAIVAPVVFRVVPAPGSADAMTLVFRRFDGVAITCAAIALVAEAAFAMRGGRVGRVDVVRGACLAIAAGLAITIGAWLSPGISDLHHGGAIRGLGEPGLALERMHRLAERMGKGELVLLLVAFVLSVTKATRRQIFGTPRAQLADPSL
jgi:hypothetical protein